MNSQYKKGKTKRNNTANSLWKMMVHGPNQPAAFFVNSFIIAAMSICLHIIHGCFCTTMTDLSICDITIQHTKSKIFTIWLFYRKNLCWPSPTTLFSKVMGNSRSTNSMIWDMERKFRTSVVNFLSLHPFFLLLFCM